MEKKEPTIIPLNICQKIFNALIPTFRPLRRLTNPTPNDGVKVLNHIRESSAPLKPEPVTHATPNKPTEAFPPPNPIADNQPLHEPAVKEKEKAPPPPSPQAVEAFAPKPNAYTTQPRSPPPPPPVVAPTPPPSIAQDKVAKAEPVAIPPQKPVATATTTNTKIAVEPPLGKDKADDKVVVAPAPAPLPPPPPPPPPKAAPKPQPPPLPAAPQRKKSEKVDDYTIPTKAKVRTGSGVGRASSSK